MTFTSIDFTKQYEFTRKNINQFVLNTICKYMLKPKYKEIDFLKKLTIETFYPAIKSFKFDIDRYIDLFYSGTDMVLIPPGLICICLNEEFMKHEVILEGVEEIEYNGV